MIEPSRLHLEVLFDLTTTSHGRGRSTGTTRVESQFATALLRKHPGTVVPVSWSSTAEQFVELDRQTATRLISLEGTCNDGVNGLPFEERGRHFDSSRRRILLVTGAGWLSNVKFLHGLFRARRTLGAELHVVVHDLVHLLFPQWSSKEDAARFGSALEAMLAGADRVLVYSDSTARDIARVTENRGLQVREIGRISLGTAFLASSGETRLLSPGLESIGESPFVLYVSTVAARKNHDFMARVWARLRPELGTRLPRLVFAGRVASDQEPLMERLSRDPALADHLVHISNATDADLAWLYSRCTFTVFPSLYEGWGLPVAESLALGKVCIASNTSSVVEFAAKATPLLDPLDIRAWCDAIRQMILEPGVLTDLERRVREHYQPITWPDAADRLWQAIEPTLRSERRSSVQIGRTQNRQPLTSLAAVIEPWKKVRSPLSTVLEYRTRVGLNLGDLPPHGLRMELALFSASSAPTRVETEVNGFVADGCIVEPGASPTIRRFDLSRDVLLRRGLLEVNAVARPLDCGPVPDFPPVILRDVRAVPLSSEEETAAIEAHRDVWRLGTILHFTGGSPYLSLLRQGWGEPAHWGVWSVEPAATVVFRPIPQPSEPVVLRVSVRGFVPPSNPGLDVDVLLHGKRLATWSFGPAAFLAFVEQVAVIPPDLLDDGLVELQLSIPGCRSPRELGMGRDERRLGIGLSRAHCTTISGPQPYEDWARGSGNFLLE